MNGLRASLRSVLWRNTVLLLAWVTGGDAFAQMSLPGAFAVSPSGAATYTLPIQTPVATGSVELKLALNYNSQAGNGSVGVGWAVSGLSSISRCPRTVLQDQVRGVVNYDANDRYCIDGVRLIVLNGSPDGVDKTEYRTELESYSKIVSNSEAGAINGPGSFVVKTKSGLAIEFGRTEDSRIEAPGKIDANGHGVVATWAVNKISDRLGNSVTVSYVEDNANGQYYPKKFVYSSTSGAVGAIYFDYEQRSDVALSFHAGLVSKSTMRLAKISTSSGLVAADSASANAWRYVLTYKTGLLSVLQSVSQCSVLSGNCLPAVSMATSTATSNAYLLASESGSGDKCLNSCGFFVSGDVDGDGRTDIIHIANDSGLVITRFANPNGSYRLASFQSSSDRSLLGSGTWQVGDVNGDGKTDLVHIANNSGQVINWLSNGDGSYNVVWFQTSSDTCLVSCGSWQSGDINGDGKMDLIHIANDDGNVITWISNGNGQYTVVWFKSGADTCLKSCGKWVSGDFNGDGLSDILHIANDSGNMISWFSIGDGSYSVSWFGNSGDVCLITCGSWQVGDVNGDGKLDLIHLMNDDGAIATWFSKGDGSFHIVGFSSNTDKSLLKSGRWVAGDLNGDGLTDLVHLADDSGHVIAWLSNGDGVYQVLWSGTTGDLCLVSCGSWQVGDVNGDGKTDLIHLADDNGFIISWRSAFDTGSRVNSISNSSYTTSIRYIPMTQAISEVVRDAAVALPRVLPLFPNYLAVAVDSSDGLGGVRTTSYLYGNFLLERGALGRGLLGFEWMQTEDAQTGLKSRTYYRQDFPFVGMTRKSVQGMGSFMDSTGEFSTNLSVTNYEYGCTDFDSTPGCQVAPLKRYFTYMSRMTETAKDLAGKVLPSKESTMVYDCDNTPVKCFGNATKVTIKTTGTDGGVYAKETVSDFSNDETNWMLGKLLRSKVTSTIPATP